MMGKAVNFWKMRGVVVSKDKIVLTILKMIAIAKMPDVSCFNNSRFIQLQQISTQKANSNPQVHTISRKNLLFIALNFGIF